MRSARRLIGRGLLAVVRALVGWAPLVLLAVWGGSYVVACLQTLTAPGTGLRVEYEGRGGAVAISADSYAFEPRTMTLVAWGLKVRGPFGAEMARADVATIRYAGGKPEVRIHHLDGRITRRANGRFEVADLFPKPKAHKKAAQLVLHVDSARVAYVDEKGGGTLVRTVVLNDLEVAGAQGCFFAKAGANIPRVGSFPLTVQRAEDGSIWVKGRLNKADLAPMLPVLTRWVDTRKLGAYGRWGAKRLLATGDFSFSLPSKRKPVVKGRWLVKATGVTVGDSLRNAKVDGTVESDGATLRGRLASSEASRTLDYDGWVRMGAPLTLAGNVRATCGSPRALWPELKRLWPAKAGFASARFAGRVAGDERGLRVLGTLGAETATVAGEQATGVQARIRADRAALDARLDRAVWMGQPLDAALRVDLSGHRLGGYARTGKVPLERVARRFGADGLIGEGQAQAVLGGTTTDPWAEVLVHGVGGVNLPDGRKAFLGAFEVRGRTDKRQLQASRLAITGPNGVLNGQGSVNWRTGALNGSLTCGAVPFATFVSKVKGLCFVDARLSGTLKRPLATARAEAYGVEAYGRTLPQVVADVRADRSGLQVSSLDAWAGVGHIAGRLGWRFGDGVLDGEFDARGLPLHEWLDRSVAGWGSVRGGKLAGTVRSPLVTGMFRSRDISVSGVPVDLVEADLALGLARADLKSGRLRMGDGSLTTAGFYAFDTKNGVLDGEFEKLPLAKAPIKGENLTLGGEASGQFALELFDAKDPVGWLKGDLQKVEVNGTSVGGGSVEASVDHKLLAVKGEVGSLDRYISLDDFREDLGAKTVTGSATAYNLMVDDLVQMLKRPLANASASVQRVAQTATGRVSARASVSGPVDDPNVVIDSLIAEEMKVAGRDAGALSAKGSYAKGDWLLDALKWDSPNGTLVGNGKVAKGGALSGDGELASFDLGWVNVFLPSAPPLSGKVSASVGAAGTLEQPELHASISASGVRWFAGSGDEASAPVDALLEDVRLIDHVIVADNGSVFYRGLPFSVALRAPLSLFTSREGEILRDPLVASLTLHERDLNTLATYAPWLDLKDVAGKVSGVAQLEGTPGDYKLSAHAVVTGSALRLASEPGKRAAVTTYLQDVKLSSDLENRRLKLTAEGRSSQGGSCTADLLASLPDYLSQGFDFRRLLDETRLDGAVRFDGFRAKETLAKASGASEATSTGEVKVAGNLAMPELSGVVDLSGVKVVLPTEFPAGGQPFKPAVNPAFHNLTFRAASGSQLQTSSAKLFVGGAGSVSGTLEMPIAQSRMTLESGFFKLPTARITLEPGGTIDAGYQRFADGSSKARADLNLEGRTTISARGASPQYETYQVAIGLRGNLLDEAGLNFEAHSEPPDLTQEQILAILGQRDLFEALGRSAQGRDQGQLGASLFTMAIPTLSGQMMESLASSLNLSYLTVEYNPFDQTIVTAGKSLGKGFMVHGRRQVSQTGTAPLRYELRLSYRLPSQDQFLRRLRLGFGIDQDKPWKVSLDWSMRF